MNTLSGMSFYDAINKVSIGAIILVAIMPCASFFTDNALYGMLFLIASFVVGIIVQTGIEFFTSPLRNNSCMLRKAYKNVYEATDQCDKNLKEDYYKAYYNAVRRNVLQNVPTLEAIERFIRSLLLVIPVLIPFVCIQKSDSVRLFMQSASAPLLVYVMLQLLGGVILWVLGKVRIECCLLSNHSVKVSLLYVVYAVCIIGIGWRILKNNSNYLNGQCVDIWALALFVLLILLALYASWYKVQLKIYELIWEDDKYIRELEAK